MGQDTGDTSKGHPWDSVGQWDTHQQGRRSRRKGADGERELAGILTVMFCREVRRGARPYLPGIEAPDVVGLPGLHVESKRRERVSLPAALRQASADAAPGEVPVVCHRSSRAPWLLTVELASLPALAFTVHRLLVEATSGQGESP